MKKAHFIISFFILLFPFFVFADQIDINSANLSQLDEIVHVGPKTAQKIIDARPYSSVSDLSRVKGIGNGKYLQDIINQGWACINCQTETTQTQQPAEVVLTAPTTTTAPIKATNDTTKDATAPIIYPSGITINELLPNPVGPDETDEWIELYNSNNFNVDLSRWQIQDTQGTITTFTIPQGTNISAAGFLVFKRPETKIMLNNDKDGLNLFSPDKNIVDSITYASAILGQSYNKTNYGWQWSATLTPGNKNIIAIAQTKNNPKTLPNQKNSVKNDDMVGGLSNISQNLNTNQDQTITNPWFLFFIVLATTLILAVTILFIKLKIFKKHVRT